MKDPHRYDNMINHDRPRAKRPMSMQNRAAQFSPFAALTGYDGIVKEEARLTDRQIELSEGEIAGIDYRLQYVEEHILDRPNVELTYFVPDIEMHDKSKKSGGKYIKHTGNVKKIDPIDKNIIFEDGTIVVIDRIIGINITSQDNIL